MRAALAEARKAVGLTSPNPTVGAILVVGNRIVARGHHRQAGLPHAEIECLSRYRERVPEDATLYVTLEPCSTKGRTGACTDLIIQSGVKTVVIGTTDPNPQHRGRAFEILKRAGIEVRTGVLADNCAAINEAFNKWIVTRRPFVIAKCGMSLDGKLTRPRAESRWITGPRARQHAHALRAQVDAILVGAETVRRDNPRLTVRGSSKARQPLRVIMTRSGKLPLRNHLFVDRFANKTTLVYRKKTLGFVLRDLGTKNVTSVLIEGGGEILSQALEYRKIDKFQIYLGPIITGGPVLGFAGRGAATTSQALKLTQTQFEKIGDDFLIIGYPVEDAVE